jgi:hypothetical protein
MRARLFEPAWSNETLGWPADSAEALSAKLNKGL